MFAYFTLTLFRLITGLAVTKTIPCDKPTFFGLIPWYQYLTVVKDSTNSPCSITNFDSTKTPGALDTTKVLGSQSPFLLIALAVLDDLIRVAALVAVGFIIYGGITYVTSQGSPDQTSKAQSTITNALIGLVVALIAVGFVTFLGNQIGGAAVGGPKP